MAAPGLGELAVLQGQGEEPAADPILILQDRDVMALAQQRERRRQAGHAGAEHQNLLARYDDRAGRRRPARDACCEKGRRASQERAARRMSRGRQGAKSRRAWLQARLPRGIPVGHS
jgi:hypothetical protein